MNLATWLSWFRLVKQSNNKLLGLVDGYKRARKIERLAYLAAYQEPRQGKSFMPLQELA